MRESIDFQYRAGSSSGAGSSRQELNDKRRDDKREDIKRERDREHEITEQVTLYMFDVNKPNEYARNMFERGCDFVSIDRDIYTYVWKVSADTNNGVELEPGVNNSTDETFLWLWRKFVIRYNNPDIIGRINLTGLNYYLIKQNGVYIGLLTTIKEVQVGRKQKGDMPARIDHIFLIDRKDIYLSQNRITNRVSGKAVVCEWLVNYANTFEVYTPEIAKSKGIKLEKDPILPGYYLAQQNEKEIEDEANNLFELMRQAKPI